MVQILSFSAMNDTEVESTLGKHRIGLTVEEARKVEKLLGRAPTLVEAVIWGIQGSEHSSYKSSKRFLQMFPTEGAHVILGPKEDSGIIAITSGPAGKRWGIVVSHESHNHPSQIVPYEGAATGVGGCVRDVLCMGARVIGNLDALRFGDLRTEESRAIAAQVVAGIAGYGNAIGVPNLGGDTQFHSGFNGNCLVNVISLGLVREDEVIHSYVSQEAGEIGYDIILVGKPTDRSGFGGATFASLTLKEEEREANTGAVQEPNPFLERHLMDSTYALFDWLVASSNLAKVGFKDLGAGGVVCSTVEQVAVVGLGADVDLSQVHVAIADLPPEVIACAETQERMCWMVHPALTSHILTHYNDRWDLPAIAEGARASVIGKVTTNGIYRLRYRGEVVCEAKATDITEGLSYERPTKAWSVRDKKPPVRWDGSHIVVNEQRTTLEQTFARMLQHPSFSSTHPITRHYDKSILGATLLECGEADAGVILPLEEVWAHVHEGEHPGWEIPERDRFTGVAVSTDGNARYGLLSPYWQGANAAVEAMRNVAAVGAVPRALTDCLNYGNPEVPEELWALQEGVRGIADAAGGVAIDGEPVPVISGNVSLYNSTPVGPIPACAIVSCIGVMRDGRKAVSQQLKRPGSTLLLLGERRDELGGSALHDVLVLQGGSVPQPEFEEVKHQILFVTEAIDRGLILACHDISDGGLLLALFEMTVPQRKEGGEIGVDVDLAHLSSSLPVDTLLFSETGGFVMEVAKAHEGELEALAAHHGCMPLPLGRTTGMPSLLVRSGEAEVLNLELPLLYQRWASVLVTALGL